VRGLRLLLSLPLPFSALSASLSANSAYGFPFPQPAHGPPMPDTTLLDAFPTPAHNPFVIEHIAEEFTSLCPETGHPDFGVITVRFQPRPDGVCVELKSLKLYLQSFRNEGAYYEAVTNLVKDDLVALMNPVWLQVISDWKGRGGIRSIIRAHQGDIPAHYLNA